MFLKKDVFRLVRSMGLRKKILSSHEESNFRPSDFAKGLRSDTSWELRMFSLSHARDEMIKTSFSTFEVLSKLPFKTAHVCTSKTFLLIKLFYYLFIYIFNFKAKRFENFICQATLFSYPIRN